MLAGTAAMPAEQQEKPPTYSKDFDWPSSLVSEPFNTRRDGCGCWCSVGLQQLPKLAIAYYRR